MDLFCLSCDGQPGSPGQTKTKSSPGHWSRARDGSRCGRRRAEGRRRGRGGRNALGGVRRFFAKTLYPRAPPLSSEQVLLVGLRAISIPS